jgi:hypothetical protein
MAARRTVVRDSRRVWGKMERNTVLGRRDFLRQLIAAAASAPIAAALASESLSPLLAFTPAPDSSGRSPAAKPSAKPTNTGSGKTPNASAPKPGADKPKVKKAAADDTAAEPEESEATAATTDAETDAEPKAAKGKTRKKGSRKKRDGFDVEDLEKAEDVVDAAKNLGRALGL